LLVRTYDVAGGASELEVINVAEAVSRVAAIKRSVANVTAVTKFDGSGTNLSFCALMLCDRQSIIPPLSKPHLELQHGRGGEKTVRLTQLRLRRRLNGDAPGAAAAQLPLLLDPAPTPTI
jgi:hypothetical protein